MFAKRLLDVGVAAALIIFNLPIMVLVAVLIKIDSCGPAIFIQTRVGKNRRRVRASNPSGRYRGPDRRKMDLGGRPFAMYKFRSMVQEAEALLPSLVNLGALKDPCYKLDNDPRVTKLGKLLRQTSIDELPQLFNVFKGDMSLVGPRPEALNVVELYADKHKRRLRVKPGLTGLQQVRCRGTKCMEERLKQDFYYIENRTLLMDFWILYKTFGVVIRGTGAL